MSETQLTGWQAIDTAPKDQEILVFTPKWGSIIALRSSEFDEWLSRMQVPVALTGEDELPSHWQSLPGAPETGETPPAA